jgi:hypothetical protein
MFSHGNEFIVPRYTGPYNVEYDDAIDLISAYEFLHGVDRTSGAMRSLAALYDDACAWAVRFSEICDRLEGKVAELQSEIELLKNPPTKRKVKKDG